jgi:hypothetical protein
MTLREAKSIATVIGAFLGTLAFVGVTYPRMYKITRGQDVTVADVASVVSAVAALTIAIITFIAFRWGYKDWKEGFLHISLHIDTASDNVALVKTTVENKGLSRISRPGIGDALLLIVPADDNVIEGYNEGAHAQNPSLKTIERTNDIDCCSSSAVAHDTLPIFDRERRRAIIRLPFYYRENVRIADETASFTVVLKRSDFPAGIWSVRFFIFPKRPTEKLHRSTQALLAW